MVGLSIGRQLGINTLVCAYARACNQQAYYTACNLAPLLSPNLHPFQSDNPNVQLHLMAFCEAHSGAQGLLLKCLVTDESQAGNVKGTQRCAGAVGLVRPRVGGEGESEGPAVQVSGYRRVAGKQR